MTTDLGNLMTGKSYKNLLSDDQFLRGVEMANAAETVKDVVNIIPEILDISMASYHHFPAIGSVGYKNLSQYYSFNMPDDVLKYYDNNIEYRDDPGIIAVFQKGQFIWHSEMIFQPYIKERNHEAICRMSFKAMGEGLCIPLYGPKNRKGFMLALFDGVTKACDEIFPYKVQALAQILHIRYCLLTETLHRHAKLTPREAEVLELISFGKSNVEIGLILNISANTVAVYVKSLFIKLGVSDRVSAAMRAETIKLKM